MPEPVHSFRLTSSRLPALGLALTGLLAACTSPQPAPVAGTASQYTYEPGRDYSWSDRLTKEAYPDGQTYPWTGLTLRAQGTPQATFVSDLNWTSASSGYGPIERDRSNNDFAGGDGRTLTIEGVTFAKGLGAHANSDIRYSLGGACSAFTATVGVDDEVGNRGSVVFQVYGDGVKLYDSGTMTGTGAGKPINVSLTGRQELRLVVTNGGDNIDYDHADWAAAQVTCTAAQPSGDKFLSDLTPLTASNGYGPYEKDRSNGEQALGDGRTLTIGGLIYPKGLGTHAASTLEYGLDGQCATFSASVGIDDEVGDRGSVVFQVYGVTGAAATKLYDSGTMTGADPARSVSVDVSGQDRLRLVVTDAGDNNYYDHADWANAKIGCTTVAASVTSVSVNPASTTLSVGAQQPFVADVQGTGAYSSDVTWTSSAPAVATVNSSGVVTAVAAGQASIKATSVADSSKSGSSAVTVTAGSSLPSGGVKVNFQPASSPALSGYLTDSGLPYDNARGYGWVREDSLSAPTHTPIDISLNARDRALSGVETRLNTLMHMQYSANTSTAAVRVPAAWEYKVSNGVYTVTVATGDASNSLDSTHALNIEGQTAVAPYLPAITNKFRTTTLRVNVTDGRLTVDALGGNNTKIDYVIIAPGNRPSVRTTGPQDGETMVAPTISVTADVNLPNAAIDLASLSPQAASLTEQATGAVVPGTLTTSGGGDVAVFKANATLKSNTAYAFDVTESLKDTSGASFLPYHTTFVTGSPTTSGTTVAFEQIALPNAPQKPYTSLEIGPDNKLYASTLTGEILRFGMQPDGTLDAPQVITSVVAANGGPRTIIGMKFDPASNADNPIMWISNGYFYSGSAAPDWSGKITRLSGPDLATVQDYVVGLPRSVRDHQTNSIAFRPGDPGALYVLQGSNSSTGAPDTQWGQRPEHLLSGALLRVDVNKITSLPLNVQTSDGGLYDPYAPGAAVTLFATGIRNAYDMVWHTNGQLYVPTNGAAAGGNTPGTPATLPASCSARPDGPYTAPAVPALNDVNTQNDFLFRVTSGGYYGHPNPLRCEWVLNGGNPTAGNDPAEVSAYPVGTLPDRNWRGFAYDFGPHASANGVIEEYTLQGNSLLKNRLMVVRYSAGKDIIVLTPGPNGDIVDAKTLIQGLTNFQYNPLDLTENRTNGNLYVAQLDEYTGKGAITLVRPK